MHDRVKNDIESLSKDLYLDQPDLWIDFQDRTNNNCFDELVLFLAAKFNYISIIKHAVGNDLIDLKSKSIKLEFNNIYNHLLYTSKQNKDHEIYNYLLSLYNKDHLEIKNDSNISENSITAEVDVEIHNTSVDSTNNLDEAHALENIFIPTYNCNHCGNNVFEHGYIVTENKTYKYNPINNSTSTFSSDIKDFVICNSCNNTLDDVTHSYLDGLCSIYNCTNCNTDLKTSGIVTNNTMSFENGNFIKSNTDYVCKNCNTKLTDKQITHFNLN